MAAGDSLVQKLLVDRYGRSAAVTAGPPHAIFAEVAHRFHFLEPPKSKAGDLLASLGLGDDGYGASSGQLSARGAGGDEYVVKDVFPLGGTLVLFDSVALPHEVLATIGRERFACSGWFHEDQQPEHHPSLI